VLCLLHEEGILWAEEANDEVSWWTLGVPDPNDNGNEVLWTKFKTYLLACVQLKQVPARLASDHVDVVLRVLCAKAHAKGSSPSEKKEQQQKATREENACKIICTKLAQKAKKAPEQLPALLPPKDGCTPAQQAVQEGKFAQTLTKAITRWAMAKRWRENLPQADKKKSPTVEAQKSESSSVTKQKEGPRGATSVAGQCPRDPKKKRTYREVLATCKEQWTQHKEGREDVYKDLPFADEIDDPFELKKVVLSKKKALNMPITFSSTQGSKEGHALIDSGATENFIDERTARRWELPMHNLVYLRKVFNVDGMENCNSMIVKSCMLCVHCREKQAHQRFYITNLGDDHILLRYPWLEEFNPDVDWKVGAMKGPQVELEVTSLAWQNWRQGQATIKIAQMEPEWEAGDELIICKTHFAQDWAIAEHAQKGKEKAVTVADQGIPNEYKRHSKVFSKEGAKQFPPTWPEDHAIKLVPDAPGTINCKTYPLTHAEI
jgi:hypothetical protein